MAEATTINLDQLACRVSTPGAVLHLGGTTVQIKTFAAGTTARLDAKVNEFLAQQGIVVRQLYPAMSFGTYMVVVEYEAR